MQFMVIERFRNQDARAIYRRLRERGRMMPEGLSFVSSWVAADLGRCFQLMETDDVTLFQRSIAGWSDFDGVRSRAGGVGRRDRRGTRRAAGYVTRKKRGPAQGRPSLSHAHRQRIGQGTSDAWKEHLGHSSGA
jgi:Protein of unknown function (DUF3303)